MTVQFSTGLLAESAVSGSLKDALDGGKIYYFSGPVPATADAAVDGSTVKLATFTESDDGTTGLTFEATAADGVLTKTAAESWASTVAATGTATFFRFCAAADAGTAASTTIARIQGTLGTTSASDAQVVSTSLTSGQSLDIPLFQLN